MSFVCNPVFWGGEVVPLLDYKCPKCGKKFDELVPSCETEVYCPDCKTKAERDYSGKVFGGFGKKGGGCSGDCKNCSGCR